MNKITQTAKTYPILNVSIVLTHASGAKIQIATIAQTHSGTSSPNSTMDSEYKLLIKNAKGENVKLSYKKAEITLKNCK
jgi:DNA-binding sugar fermentation-stimulating protein